MFVKPHLSDGLQAARAFACVNVLLSHTLFVAWFVCGIKASPFQVWYSNELGNVGVNLFFVLSGFLMGGMIRKRKACMPFVFRRLLRIYPPLWGTVLICLFLTYVFGRPLRFDAAQFFLIPSSTLIPPWQILTWSLVYEMCFYCVVAFILAIGANRSTANALLAGWLLVIVAAYCYQGEVSRMTPGKLILLGLPNILFIFGSLASLNPKLTSTQLSLPKLVLMATAMWGLSIGMFSVNRLVHYLILAATFNLVLAGFRDAKITWPRAISRLGDASYGIYLLHFAILFPLVEVVALFFPERTFAVYFPLLFASTLLLSLAYGLIEHAIHQRVLNAIDSMRVGKAMEVPKKIELKAAA